MPTHGVLNERVQVIPDEISKDIVEILSKSPEPVTPAIVKQHILKYWDSVFVDESLSDGIDYKLEVDGTTVTVTPLS